MTSQFDSKIKIFSGTDMTAVEEAVNDFTNGKNVFATQHSTCATSGEGMYTVIYTFVVFYRVPVTA